jgi:hypothetical protein
MIDAFGVLASVLLPWVAGTCAVLALWRGREHGPSAPLALGYGYLVGAFAVTIVMLLTSAAGIRWSLPLLAGLIVALGIAAAWLARGAPRPGLPGGGLRDALAPEPRALRWLFWIALALVVVRLAGLAVDVYVSPLRAYDAWAQWATKARVWFEQGRVVRFVTAGTWLASGDPLLYYDSNPGHPPVIPLLQAWTAMFLGAWNESRINAPWVAIGIALPLAFYAQARNAGASAPLAMIATWLLMSLPILDIHIGLAGCADLFMGAAYGMAAMAMWRWSVTREWPMAALALVVAIAMIPIKVEGVLWLATLVPGIVIALHRRAGFVLAGTTILAFLAYLAFGPRSLPMMGYTLRTRPADVLGPLAEHVFAFDNWHLSGYAVIAIVAWRWRILLSPRIAPMTLTMAAAFGLVVVVFFFTSAAVGVENETLVNRFLLHLAPALAFYTLVVYVEGRERAGTQPSLQATNAADA